MTNIYLFTNVFLCSDYENSGSGGNSYQNPFCGQVSKEWAWTLYNDDDNAIMPQIYPTVRSYEILDLTVGNIITCIQKSSNKNSHAHTHARKKKKKQNNNKKNDINT